MPVEIIDSRRRYVSVSGAVSDYISENRAWYGEDARIEQLESENSRLRGVVSELIEALAGILPNEVLQSLCGGSGRGFVRRNGSDEDVLPLDDRLDGIDHETCFLRKELEDHRGTRSGWAHGD